MAACLWVGAAGARAQTLTPTQDNNVNRGAATTTQANGATFTLKVASATQTNARLGFLKFDLSGVPSIADQGTFTATTTGATTTNFTFRLYALNAGAAGTDWSEDTITYNNRPAASTTGTLVDTASATVLGTDTSLPTGTAAGAPVSFTFSGLNAVRQPDNSLTLIFIVNAQTDGGPTISFASSENTNPAIVPTLTIVPEPTAAALLAAASGLLLQRRRRSN